MTLDAGELFVAGSGHIFVAPLGSTLPSSVSTSLDAAYQDLGYLTEDGFRMTPNITTVDLMGWQSTTPLRTVLTERGITLALDFMQSNEDVFKLFFGGGSFSGTTYTPPAAGSVDERVLVADVIDGSRNWRFWFPRVTVSAGREVAFKKDASANWGVDMKVLQPSSGALYGFDYADASFPAYPYP